MSVPMSERRPSEVEYIVILQNIEMYFISQNINQKARIEGLSQELTKISIDLYNKATMYFELTNGKIQGTLAQKKKYCKSVMYTSRVLASQINILIRYRMDNNKPVQELVNKTAELKKVFDLLQKQLKKLNYSSEEEKNLSQE